MSTHDLSPRCPDIPQLPLIVYAIFGTSKQLSIGPDILGSLLVRSLDGSPASSETLQVGLVVTALPPPTDPSDSSAAAAAALSHFLSLMVRPQCTDPLC